MMSVGSDMTYELLQGRINWRPSDKFNVVLSGGFEDRQFLDSGSSDIYPISSLTLEYHPFEQTLLSINTARTVSASYYGDNTVTSGTSVSAGLRQRFLSYFYLDVSGGYAFTSYSSPGTVGPVTGREDDTTFFSVRLTTQFLRRATLAIFYYDSETASNDAGYSYSNNQVGLELGYRF
jgi:hypothetical protein